MTTVTVQVGDLLIPRWLASVLVRSITSPKKMTQEERSEYDRNYYQVNRDTIRARHAACYREHRSEELIKAAKYRTDNRLAINLSAKIGLPLDVCRRMLEQK